MPADIPTPPLRRGLELLLSLAALVLVVAALRAASEFFIPVVLGLFFAIFSLPLVGWLENRGIPRFFAVIVAIAYDLLVLVLLVVLIVNVMPDFQASAAKYEEQAKVQFMKNAEALQTWVDDTFGPFQDWVNRTFRDSDEFDPEREVINLKAIAKQVLSLDSLISVVNWMNQINLVQTLISLITKTFFALIIMIFFLIESHRFVLKLEVIEGVQKLDFSRFRRVGFELQQYLAIKTLVSIITGILAGSVCGLFGVEFAILWGMLAFLFNFVPTIGSLVAALPPLVVALIQLGFWQAAVLAVIYICINVGIGNFLEPTLLGHEFGLSTIVVLLSVLFWGWLWGPVGMFLAVPMTMLIKMMLEGSDDYRWVAILMSKDGSLTKQT